MQPCWIRKSAADSWLIDSLLNLEKSENLTNLISSWNVLN